MRPAKNCGAPAEEPPFATVLDAAGRRLLAAVNPAAAAAGLAPGMPLADALSFLPGLATTAAEPAADAAALRRLAEWCGRYSPWAAPDGADGVRIEITGCAHLWGGEEALAADLAARLGRRGIAGRIAIADTLGAAWAAARFAETSRSVVILPPGEAGAAIAPLPVEALRLDPATAQGLRRVGLRRVGDLHAMPRAALARRFDEGVARRLDQALGDQPEPLSPLGEAPARRVRLSFAEPIADPADLACAAERLVADLVLRLAREGSGARRLDLAFHRVDGRVERITLGVARPSRDPRHLAALLTARLDTIDPGLGVEDMILAAFSVEPLPAEQLGLAGEAAGAAAPLLDRLGNRLGPGAVYRLAPRASHIPERASMRAPVASPSPTHPCGLGPPSPAVRERGLSAAKGVRAKPGGEGRGEGRGAGTDRTSRRARSGCSIRRSRSKPSGCCPTIRRSASPGGAADAGWRAPTGRSGSPRNGGGRGRPTRSATITGSRTRRGGASGCSGRASPAPTTRRAGLSMASFPDIGYAELQVTTNFSFLRGAAHPDELAATAAALGHRAIGVADRSSLAGIVRAHQAAKEIGIRLVVGCRLDLSDGASLLVYPTDRAAYGRLTRLLTLGKRCAPKGECRLGHADVVAHGEGQIVVALPSEAADMTDFAARVAADFKGRAYLAAHHLYRGDDARRLARLAALGESAGLPLVATNDVLYHISGRRPLQDVLTCIREGCTISEAGFRLAANAERHLKPASEMARLFRGHEDAVARSLEIVARCHFSLDELRYEYPEEADPDGRTPQRRLADLAWAGAAERFHSSVTPAKAGVQARRSEHDPLDSRVRGNDEQGGIPDKIRALIAHELAIDRAARLRPLFPDRARHRAVCAQPRHPVPGARLGR